MTEAIVLLTALCILLGVAAWAYRCEFLTTTGQYNKLLKDYEESTRKNGEQRDWCERLFLELSESGKARIAAEEHVKALRTQLDEIEAWCEAQKREEADTEIYTEEGGDAKEAGAVSASGGAMGIVTRNEGAAHAEPGTSPEGCAAAANYCDAGSCCGVGRCSQR